LFDIVM